MQEKNIKILKPSGESDRQRVARPYGQKARQADAAPERHERQAALRAHAGNSGERQRCDRHRRRDDAHRDL